jgi:hypothetical protein
VRSSLPSGAPERVAPVLHLAGAVHRDQIKLGLPPRRHNGKSKARIQRTPKEKWQIELEGLRSGDIAETCRKYEIASNLYYRWKDEAQPSLPDEEQARKIKQLEVGSPSLCGARNIITTVRTADSTAEHSRNLARRSRPQRLLQTWPNLCNIKSRFQTVTTQEPMSVDWISTPLPSGSKRHIAVVAEPYLEKILSGTKTIDSRISTRAIAPFATIGPQDTIFLKAQTGPVVGRAIVKAVSFLNVRDIESLTAELRPFCDEIQFEPSFLKMKRDARFCTLIRLDDVQRVYPFPVQKRDRRGWVVLRSPGSNVDPSTPAELQTGSPISSTERRRRARLAAARDLATTPKPLCLRTGSPKTLLRVFGALRANAWREQWWTKPLDAKAAAGIARIDASVLHRHVLTRLNASLNTLYLINGTLQQYRDGYQTPYIGDIVFYGQHGLALCCRKCLRDWYGVPTNTRLSDAQVMAMSRLIVSFVSFRIDGLPL